MWSLRIQKQYSENFTILNVIFYMWNSSFQLMWHSYIWHKMYDLQTIFPCWDSTLEGLRTGSCGKAPWGRYVNLGYINKTLMWLDLKKIQLILQFHATASENNRVSWLFWSAHDGSEQLDSLLNMTVCVCGWCIGLGHPTVYCTR